MERRDAKFTEVTIERDYTKGILTQFEENFPEELSGKISSEEFKSIIQNINGLFRRAETYDYCGFLESLIGCATCFTLYICYRPRYSRILGQLDRFLINENEKLKSKGVEWLNPFSNGLLHITVIVKAAS
eukprot:TRINITY_DN3969_c0_g1_i1.p1 TRINITY_DN3969_c0_g1~~TRINITY_DN3969_c0_g1_i1.p1  ORF type:complete len:130 (-),score=29.51 TRINITY_DN3969_c0_g1_i1:112-501(-)